MILPEQRHLADRIAELERQVAELRSTLECVKGWCPKGGQAEAIISAALAQAKTAEKGEANG